MDVLRIGIFHVVLVYLFSIVRWYSIVLLYCVVDTIKFLRSRKACGNTYFFPWLDKPSWSLPRPVNKGLLINYSTYWRANLEEPNTNTPIWKNSCLLFIFDDLSLLNACSSLIEIRIILSQGKIENKMMASWRNIRSRIKIIISKILEYFESLEMILFPVNLW